MYKEAIIATSNKHKFEEYKRMLEPLGYKVESLLDLHINTEIPETGKTFAENAMIKAKFIGNMYPNALVIGDDSGLEVHALNNFPGIYSHRFMEEKTYREKQLALIKMLEGKKDWSANFTCCIALVNYKGLNKVFTGKVDGEIVKEIEGDEGFGYDPIFYSYELGKTFGQVSGKEKDSVSHRGRALKQVIDFLKNN